MAVNHRVVGSNPTWGDKKIFKRKLTLNELIVQLAEHVAHNNAVVGSSPTWLIIINFTLLW